ncbi:MAG TPA: hypothetical protein VKT77_21705 [Chthonomonadaceae bacterium]|nr:hypothetical protein [Chthonomonadaceae bacterium]
MKWTVLTLLFALTLFGRAASAQVMVPISPPPHVDQAGPYLWGIGGHEIIYVKASAEGWNAYERCSILDRRTVEILTRAQAPPLRSGDFKVVERGGRTMLVVRKYLLTDVTPADAKADGSTVHATAEKWISSVRRAYPDIAPRAGKFGI